MSERNIAARQFAAFLEEILADFELDSHGNPKVRFSAGYDRTGTLIVRAELIAKETK